MTYSKSFFVGFFLFSVCFSGCTEEQRNKVVRETNNLLGKDFKVSYIDSGVIVKNWTVRDGKITTGKDDQGTMLGYYYFWAEGAGYVQIPIERTIIEEIKK